jgi:2-oxoglutarate ferredoxin oxidoreductase subunit alpha
MMQKRMRKLELATREARLPDWYGAEQADVTLVCWGSSLGACRQAALEINAAGGAANVLHFQDLWPMAPEVASMLKSCKELVVVEQNYTAQLARLLRMATGIEIARTLTKYDGRPFAPDEIIGALRMEAVSGYRA